MWTHTHTHHTELFLKGEGCGILWRLRGADAPSRLRVMTDCGGWEMWYPLETGRFDGFWRLGSVVPPGGWEE